MPTGVRNAPSVAPADMAGTTGMPGQYFAVSFSTGPITLGFSGWGALGTSLRALSHDVGVDVLSFGGTKNGLMFGEAVVFFNRERAENFRRL